jgi:hypothetical protein
LPPQGKSRLRRDRGLRRPRGRSKSSASPAQPLLLRGGKNSCAAKAAGLSCLDRLDCARVLKPPEVKRRPVRTTYGSKTLLTKRLAPCVRPGQTFQSFKLWKVLRRATHGASYISLISQSTHMLSRWEEGVIGQNRDTNTGLNSTIRPLNLRACLLFIPVGGR